MRVGIFGGTFNPVHNGHLLAAQGAQRILQLNEVLWIPTHIPSHKEMAPGATAEDRLKMVELAIAGYPAFHLSRVELDRETPSYTIDTVRQLQADPRRKGADWFLLVGSDMAKQLPTWRQIETLKKMVQCAVIPRPGVELTGLPVNLKILDVKTPDVSASDIRKRVQEKKPIDSLVPEAVARYIDEKGLYR